MQTGSDTCRALNNYKAMHIAEGGSSGREPATNRSGERSMRDLLPKPMCLVETFRIEDDREI